MPLVGRRFARAGHRETSRWWANTDLNVGAIVALSPALDDATKAEFRTWGPGKYDPRHHVFDGTNIIALNSPSLPIVIPPIYGLKGVGFETFTGDGPIRTGTATWAWGRWAGTAASPIRESDCSSRRRPDLVAPKLAALLEYQLSLHTPKPPRGSYDRAAAERGKHVFRGRAQCRTCHRSPLFTDVLSGPDRREPFLHDPSEVGMDPAYAARSATGKYRTTPLRGLLQHPPYFHDGSAPDLPAVVNHYDELFPPQSDRASEGGSGRVSESRCDRRTRPPHTRRGLYGHVSPTRVTVETLMPSAPPAPSRIPLTDTRLPTLASSRDSTNFNVMVRSPSSRVGSSVPTPPLSTRSGAVALVIVQSAPLLGARHPTTRTSVLAGSSPGPSFGMIWMLATVSGDTSVAPAGIRWTSG